MMVELYDEQIEAVKKLKNGSILCGDVGSGKSRTGLAYYYFKACGGKAPLNEKGHYEHMKDPRDLYIITTAKKRDSGEWDDEAAMFLLTEDRDNSPNGVIMTVDSWNNIKKYKKVYGAFFIFDEQRVTGKGPWVKTFWDIARKNKWIMLSATPGDTWSDYVPVFVANGFYRNRTEFEKRHCIFNRYVKWPQIDRYIDESILVKHRNDILVQMPVIRHTERVYIDRKLPYDKELYKTVALRRWNPFDNEPISETGKLCYLMRKVVNMHEERCAEVLRILCDHPKAIIFYNYDYELEILENLLSGICYVFTQWNGHKHEKVPEGDAWVYLVQYLSGAEGWNCITTDTMIFFSLNYSYRVQVQSEGRIDRINTPYKNLYYYRLFSNAPIDAAILRALHKKKTFNEKSFLRI